jgi:hypothetical protein
MPDYLYRERISLSKQENWGKYGVRMGLALFQVGSGEVYRRAGLVRWMLREVFDGTQPVEVRII